MPELPEVETIARGLAKRITGDVIDSVWLGQKTEPLKSPAREIAGTVEHSRINAIHRMGKNIVFDLETPQPRSGDRMQPTARPEPVEGAQAVGRQWEINKPRTGRKKWSYADAALASLADYRRFRAAISCSPVRTSVKP